MGRERGGGGGWPAAAACCGGSGPRWPELDEKWGLQEDGGASGKFRERGSRNQPTEGWRGAAEMNRHDAGGAPSN